MKPLVRLLTVALPIALCACALPLTGTAPVEAPAVPPPTEPGPAPTEAPIPGAADEAIQIIAPGPGSRLVSPMTVRAVTTLPSFENVLTLRVLLDDGTELVPTQAVVGSGPEGGPLTFEVALTFDVAEERPAFVQAFLVSPRDGGVTHLASVVVTALPGGMAEVQPAAEEAERLQILAPAAGDSIRGGVAHVEGIGVASFEQTLLIEVVDAFGEVIGMQPVIVQAPDFGQPGSFTADVAYTLTEAGAGRIVVRDISPAHGGDVHRSSIEVDLAP